MSKRVAIASLAAGAVAGGLVGVVLGVTGTAGAASPSPSPSSPSGSATTAPFKSNEDPTHEAGESAAQEAAENSDMVSGMAAATRIRPTRPANRLPERRRRTPTSPARPLQDPVPRVVRLGSSVTPQDRCPS
jgi:hypothetical protein